MGTCTEASLPTKASHPTLSQIPLHEDSRLDAESRELRVVVSRGPRAVARRAQRVRATRGPEAHYNA